MSVTNIRSEWVSGNLVFYEGGVGQSVTGDVFTIGTAAVKIGGTSQDIDFQFYTTGSKSFIIDAGAGTIKVAKMFQTFGVKSSVIGDGIPLNVVDPDGSGIAGALRIFTDDGGVVPASGVDINAIESRYLVATDLSAHDASIKAIRGHIRLHTGKLPVAAAIAGVCGYIEADGTSVISTGMNAAVLAMLESSGGAVSGAANTVLSAFGVHTTGTWSLTTARSTIMHIDSPASFTSFLDIGAASGMVTSSQLTGGTALYLTCYVANKAYTIQLTTTT